MPRVSKSDQIKDLINEISAAGSEISKLSYRLAQTEQSLERAESKIAELYAANDNLIHTPEFKADTEAAFDRGRQDGIRSLSGTAQNSLFLLADEVVSKLNELVNKYTRDLAMTKFTGILEQPETVKDLPDTDFTQNMLADIKKIDMQTSETEHTVVH